jgi:hypothetical protein
MKKPRLYLFLIFVIAFTMTIMTLSLTACKKDDEKVLESEIIKTACEEIGAEPDGASLTFVSSEPIPWADGDAYCYVMEAGGEKYLVGVRRSEKEIYFVDVEEKLPCAIK